MPLTPQLQKALEANLFEELHLGELPLADKEKILLGAGEIINKNIVATFDFSKIRVAIICIYNNISLVSILKIGVAPS